MIPVISVDNIRKSDTHTIALGTSGVELMHRAALGVYNAMDWKGNIAIVCGGGNNGGDGYALAEILYQNGKKVTVFALSDRLTPDSAYYYQRCKALKVNIQQYNDQNLDGYDILVDCIFGTGFRGEASGIYKNAIDMINKSPSFVVSVDINSGLNGDSGLGLKVIKSDLTVSIGYYKGGHFLNMAKDLIKEKVNADIGIELIEKPFYLIEDKDFLDIFPERKQFSHKTTYGITAILGGSIRYSGAVKLANLSLSALRSGSGMCKVIVPSSISDSIMPYILESSLEPIPDKEGQMLFEKETLSKALKGVSSLAIGMGWGQSHNNQRILEYILSNYDIPIVIDADGINNLCDMGLDILKQTKCKVILTPHLGEFSRLINKSVEEINSNPIAYAKNFAKEYKSVLLLKGPCTIVTDGEKVYLVDKGDSGMATGGSGDVLSGIIGGINAFSKSPFILNAACGAYISGVAGEIAAKEKNQYSMLASDTINNIPKAINQIIN